MFEIEGWNKGTYFIETDIRDILNDFRWSLTSVYGPAKHEWSRDFIKESKSYRNAVKCQSYL